MPKKSITISGRTLTLDARPDRLDLRDLPYRPPVVSLDPIFPSEEKVAELFPRYFSAKLVLDQGSEGACTGFGLAAVVNYLWWARSGMTMTEKDKVSPRMLYHLARFYDEWPGEDYDGSSCRGALKGWHRHGVCQETLWPYRTKKGEVRFVRPKAGWDVDALSRPLGVYYRIDKNSVVDIQAAIYQIGAVYVSADVHKGWEVKSVSGALSHRQLPVIKHEKELAGGHAFCMVGYNDIGFVIQNSWGPDWGASGFAVLTYEDWVANGSDAWVAALGAPLSRSIMESEGVAQASRSHFVRGGDGRSNALIAQRDDRLGSRADTWTEQEAYWHTMVTGNDGVVINRLPHLADEKDNAKWIGLEKPLEWFGKQSPGKPWRLAVYAHGGLNSEADSVERVRILGPCFEKNGIYPVFTTWKSGWAETIGNMLQEQVKSLFGGAPPPARGLTDVVTDATDRALEVFLREFMVKGMWSEMKENVEAAATPGRGLDLLAEQIAALNKASGGKLELHLVGHSAGSFVCGRLLTELRARKMAVQSCTLFAPACGVDFALDHYRPAVDKGQLARNRFRIHLLSDAVELDDSVGPYQKSLLYLVSRSLERWHKTPILGLAGVYDRDRASDSYWHAHAVGSVKKWQTFFFGGEAPKGFSKTGKPDPGGKLKESNLFILSDKQVNTGPKRINSSHGCFDNSIEIVSDTIEKILGGKLSFAVKNLDY